MDRTLDRSERGLGGKAGWRRDAVLYALVAALVVNVVMLVLQPLPQASKYDMAVRLSVVLLILWFVVRWRPRWLFHRWVLVAVALGGGLYGWEQIAHIGAGGEVVRVYESLFDALERGVNPYTTEVIYHLDEAGRVVWGVFNYPPLELVPYWVVYRLWGEWNVTVFTTTLIVMHGLAAGVLWWTFRRRALWVLPWFPLLLFVEVRTNVATALVATAVIVALIVESQRRPGPFKRVALALAFGLGLLTKFIVMPLMAAYYWHRLAHARGRRRLVVALEAGGAVGVALLVMAPYGVGHVLESTLLFNLSLDHRALYTTFYSNTLSGVAELTGLGDLYPIVASLCLIGAILAVVPRLPMFQALLVATSTFCVVATTPEPQFIPVLLYVAVAGSLGRLEDEGSFEASPS